MQRGKIQLYINIIFSFVATCAMSFNLTNIKIDDENIVNKYGRIIDGVDIKYLFVFLGIIWGGNYAKKIVLEKKHCRHVCLLSGIFSGCIVLGNWCNIFEVFFFDSVLMIANVIIFWGYFYLSYIVLKIIWHYLHNVKSTNIQSSNKLMVWLFDKHVIFTGIIIIVFCWLPFMIVYWPGIAIADGLRSLTFYYGKVPWTNHHPYLISLIMGICMDIGKFLGKSDQWGLFVYTIMQVLVAYVTFGRILNYMKRYKLPYWLRVISIAFFAVFPYWKPLFYSLQKDPIYSLVLVNLTLSLVDIYVDAETTDMRNNKKNIVLSLLMILLCLLRNNGVYVIAGLLVVVLFMYIFVKRDIIRKIGKGMILCCCITILVYGIFIKVGLPLLNVTNSSGTKEAFSVLFQQTARYQKYYGDDVDEEEREILTATFKDYEHLGELYNPGVSDPVKDTYNKTASFGNYLKAWFSQFLKHPICYVEAFCYHSYKYYAPNVMAKNATYKPIVESERYIPDNYLDVRMIEEFSQQRALTENGVAVYKKIPVISLTWNTGMYFWIIVVVLILLYERKCWHGIITVIPSLATILIAILSPVNGDLRYIMPAMCSIPVILMVMIREFMKHNE